MRRSVAGVGVRDVETPTSTCPYYQLWKDMLRRCYSPAMQLRHPTYVGCSVAPEWHHLSAFMGWMQQQDWQGKDLDKDLLVPGNKVYGPDTCVFVSAQVNNFLTDRARHRRYGLGVQHLPNGKYRAACSQLGGGRAHLGVFDTAEEAHEAWRTEKHRLALILADQQTNPRIAAALRARYKPRGTYEF